MCDQCSVEVVELPPEAMEDLNRIYLRRRIRQASFFKRLLCAIFGHIPGNVTWHGEHYSETNCGRCHKPAYGPAGGWGWWLTDEDRLSDILDT